jgi:clan AA aspartic protease
MITGVVTASRQAIIRLTVRGPEGQEQEFDAVIDTGFDGILTLPPALITTLGLVWRRRGRALLADGSESLFDIYETIVIWDGEPRRIAVDEADIDPLVGMSLLYSYELIVQAIQGGTVIIQHLPQR